MELSMWEIMAPAFVECLVLVGIHSYLGLHVIRRKVIFVDLALAQIAALGTTIGFLAGIMPDTMGAYWFSLGFTIIGAAVFSISRLRNEKIPQEAVIGVTYAIAASVAILVIDKAPHGAEHIKEIISGSILWVEWGTIRNAAIVYSVVGIFHYIFRKKFILISENPKEAYNAGMSVKFWDFLFYVSFGLVITHSVGTAGVLLVFVFLVVPAIAASLITSSWRKQLLIGWGLGTVVSFAGLLASYRLDIPSGPAIIAVYGIVLVLIALIIYVIKAQERRRALVNVILGTCVTAVILAGFHSVAQLAKKDFHAHEQTKSITEDEHMLHEIQVHDKLTKMTPDEVDVFLSRQDNAKEVHRVFDAEDEPYLRFKIAQRMVVLERWEGLELVIDLLEHADTPFLKEEIAQYLQSETGQNFGYSSEKDEGSNTKAIGAWKTWLRENRD